jgi:hypothetical protein
VQASAKGGKGGKDKGAVADAEAPTKGKGKGKEESSGDVDVAKVDKELRADAVRSCMQQAS